MSTSYNHPSRSRSTPYGVYALIFIVFFNIPLFSLATFTSGGTAAQLATKIQGNGITITNAVIRRGSTLQTGTFDTGVTGASLAIDSGILLTTMDINEAFTTNNDPGTSNNFPTIASDSDLVAIDSLATYDTVVLEFDITLDANTRLLLVNYQFASEEYNEYVGTKFNDAFGFFISGGDLNQTYNIARVVNPQIFTNVNNLASFPPVTVNNVNNGTPGSWLPADPATIPPDYTNAQYFIDNEDGSAADVEFDGLTVGLNATLDNLTPGMTYHFKMALADTGDNKYDSGVFVNSINGVRAPQICYDYSYKQNDQFFTETYDITRGPRIAGTVLTGVPVDVGIYIKNIEDSEILATNVKLDVLDLNGSQVTYTPDSVNVTDPGTTSPRFIADNTEGMTNTSLSIENIPIADFGSLEYFFAYYSLDPLVDTLDTPIDINISYTLTIPLSTVQSIDIDVFSIIDEDTPLCLASGGAYLVQKGVFNLEHASLNGTQYYNLPTQVVRRPDAFKVVAYDPDDADLVTRRDLNSTAFVELIDAGGFQDVDTSCNEPSSSLTEKILVNFEDSAFADFNEAVILANSLDATQSVEDFFGNARQNTAFRISYNVLGDGNQSLINVVETPPGSNRYIITNYTDLAQGVINENSDLPPNEQNKCREDVVIKSYLPNGNVKTTTYTTMPQACGNASDTNTISAEEVATCMQCVFGYNTKYVCSRDNFAVRPEAFDVKIKDNNQATDPLAATVDLPPEADVSAGYSYRYDVNATTHTDGSAAKGYTRSFTIASTLDHSVTTKWDPDGHTVSGCNDINDKYLDIYLVNGIAINNPNMHDNVGRYQLQMKDSGWTNVDQSPISHHTGSYFLSGNDCLIDQSTVPNKTTQLTRANIGCTTSSDHVNNDAGLSYFDHNITVHPYDFNLSTVTFNKGKSKTEITADDYVYINNIRGDSNMSVRYSGDIKAVGANTASLSNFVKDCYAEDIDLDLNTSALPATPIFKYRLRENNATTTDFSFSEVDGNNTGSEKLPTVTIPASRFTKGLFGESAMEFNVNFDRNITTPVNPLKIVYNWFNVSCTTPVNCQSRADMTLTHLPDTTLITDLNITHIYGRLHTPRQRVADTNPADLPATAQIPLYYEFYCNSLSGCNINDYTTVAPILSPNRLLSQDDVRWYVQALHDVVAEGNSTFTQTRNNANDARFANGANMDIDTGSLTATYTYDGVQGYPYKVTIELGTQDWLLYNRYDITATENEFELEFFTTGQWSGKDESNMGLDANSSTNVNRRVEW